MAETATRKSSVASRAQAVENVDTDVDIKYIPAEAEITPPPALAALSDEEVAKLGKKAMLKLDLRIMPAIVIMYILNYLDRQNIASAKLANIITDLHMTNVEFQTCISLLFVGYSTFCPCKKEGFRDLANAVSQSLCKCRPTCSPVKLATRVCTSAWPWVSGESFPHVPLASTTSPVWS